MTFPHKLTIRTRAKFAESILEYFGVLYNIEAKKYSTTFRAQTKPNLRKVFHERGQKRSLMENLAPFVGQIYLGEGEIPWDSPS